MFSSASLLAFQMLAMLNRKMDDRKMTENKNLKNVGFFYKFFFSKQYFVEEPWSSGYREDLGTNPHYGDHSFGSKLGTIIVENSNLAC